MKFDANFANIAIAMTIVQTTDPRSNSTGALWEFANAIIRDAEGYKGSWTERRARMKVVMTPV